MKLGRYRAVRRIAVGGMAELFLARGVDGNDDAPVVLKVVLPQHAGDPEFLQMLHDEARLAAKLDHPNLVRLLGHGDEGGRHYLVLEYVDGPTLSELLAAARGAGQPPPLSVALDICRQLLEALRYLHQLADDDGRPLEVVHRDVTPSNVLVQPDDDRVKLGDLGIALHRLRGARTRTGVIKGTVQYMAPEQVTGSGVDARADLYGVGLILFELLTLRPFIHAEREVELLRLAEDPPWVAPTELRPDLEPGPALDRLVQRALRRFPEERFATAAAFLEALEEVRARLEPGSLGRWVAELPRDPRPEDRPVSLASPGRPATRVAPAASAPRSRLLLWALLLALPVAGLAALWTLVLPPKADTTPAVDAAPPPDLPLPDADAPADLSPPDRFPPDLSRPDRPRRRIPRHAAPRALSPTPDAASPGRARERDALLARLSAARDGATRRGILDDDLPATLRDRLRALERQARSGDPAALGPRVAALEQELSGLKVDRALVEAKLGRVDALLKRGGAKVPAALRERAGLALQELMDGRYASANRQLNEILRGLR